MKLFGKKENNENKANTVQEEKKEEEKITKPFENRKIFVKK